MYTVEIDETTEAGQEILSRLHANPEAGKIREFKIPRDENSNPIGVPLEEVFARMDKNLSEYFGVDFAKVFAMLETGELDESQLTNQILLRPEFKYEPHLNFQPQIFADK